MNKFLFYVRFFQYILILGESNIILVEDDTIVVWDHLRSHIKKARIEKHSYVLYLTEEAQKSLNSGWFKTSITKRDIHFHKRYKNYFNEFSNIFNSSETKFLQKIS